MCQRSLNFSRHWCSCSRGLRALIVLDDVWIAQHLEPFAPLRGGKYGVTGKNSSLSYFPSCLFLKMQNDANTFHLSTPRISTTLRCVYGVSMTMGSSFQSLQSGDLNFLAVT